MIELVLKYARKDAIEDSERDVLLKWWRSHMTGHPLADLQKKEIVLGNALRKLNSQPSPEVWERIKKHVAENRAPL